MIEKMLEMPDEKLSAMLKIVLSTAGFDTKGKDFNERTIKKIRSLLSEVTESDIERFTYLIERYKNGG